jgi:NAD(P)-dependent dehydrogenase (short-subunit alcohol dehydrogenase family)
VPSTILITGAASGIGNLTARVLAAAGHHVFASMRSLAESQQQAADLVDFAPHGGFALTSIELDMQSQADVDTAVLGASFSKARCVRAP